MRKGNRLNYITAVILALLVCFTILAASGIGGKAYAASSEYSNVLDDLNKDTNFNSMTYPETASDNTLNVIQIAEGKDGELFIYVYQPSGQTKDLAATTVRLSQAINDNARWSDYKLTKINSSGVFFKYKVDGITLKTDSVRYYDITAIHRKRESFDEETGNDNTINEVACEVGQLWTAVTFKGEVSYEMKVIETLKVDSEYIGALRYGDGFQFDGTKYTDAHFYAFSTRNKIDRLMSADIVFETTAYSQLAGQSPKTQPPVKHEITLYGEERSNDGGGWFGKKYTWDTLVSAKEFVTNAEKQGFTFDTVKKNEILKQQWVLNFYETPYTCEAGGKDVLISAFIPFGFIWTLINGLTTTGETVSSVSLLRLEYDYNGEIYNLGVVSKKVTGSNDPVNGIKEDGFLAYLWNCIKKLIAGTASDWEKFVAIVTIVVALIVFGCAVGFIKWFWRKVFK